MRDDRLISLNAALDVLHGYFDGMLETDTVCPKDLYNEIEALPSAQPVEDASAMCGECDAWNQYKNYPHPGWIPCSERLPKEKDAGILNKFGIEKMSEYVIATVEVKDERMTVTACTYNGKWNWNMKYAFPDYKIVAWMPLPEPWIGKLDE